MNDDGVKELIEAIQDLTRVTLLVHGDFSSKAEAVRKLDEVGIPPQRIANMMGMQTKDVSSSLAKARKGREDKE